MLTLFANAPTVSIITSVRTTYLGTQYTVSDLEHDHIVTVNPHVLTCSCRAFACFHLQLVQDQRARQAQADARRAAYRDLFDLSYAE